MSKKVIFKENLSTITAMSPLAGAVAFAMALPGLASAEDFTITSQADLDTAISLINEQNSGEAEGGGLVEVRKGQGKVLELEDGDYSHSITFSSNLSGQTLELPSLYIEGYVSSLDIDGSGAPDLTLNMTSAYYQGHVEVDEYAEVSISNINLTLQRSAEGEGYGLGFRLDDGAHLELDNVTFNHNSENGPLTGIYSDDWATVTIQDSTLVGGGIQEKYIPEADAYGEYSFDNFAPRYTEAFSSDRSYDVSVINSTIEGFHSKYGPVFDIQGRDSSDFEIIGSTFSGNAGGSILSIGSRAYGYPSATIHDSVFSNNESKYSTLSLHGDMYSWGYFEASITNTSIHGNTRDSKYSAYSYGPGTVGFYGEMSVAMGNVTIANNTGSPALNVYVNDGGYDIGVVMAHVTIANNNTQVEIEGEGGAINVDAPAVYVEGVDEMAIVNSIISNNSGADLLSYDYNLSVDYSLVGYTEGGAAADAVGEGGGNLLDVDPLLGSFAGSGSKAGFRLRSESPAIDSGSLTIVEDAADDFGIDLELVSDQSGNTTRVAGGTPDMGAFEWAGQAGAAPGNPSKGSSDGLFGNMGLGFLSSMFALGWLRRKLKK